MPSFFKKIFRIPEPLGEPKPVRQFDFSEKPLEQDKVAVEPEGWRIDSVGGKETIRLFELAQSGLDQSMVTYRASLKTENLKGRANLELRCVMPGTGEFASKGKNPGIAGATDWKSDEVQIYFKKGMAPEKIELRVTAEGPGRVWIKDIEVLQTPMSL